MGDFYMGSVSVKFFLPIFKMNFLEIVDIALPAEGVFHNLVFVSIKKTYPMQAYKILHGLWGMNDGRAHWLTECKPHHESVSHTQNARVVR